MPTEMYALQEGNGLWTLRQERYREYLSCGMEHPNDVCAVANSLEELRAMCEKYWSDADYSGNPER